MNLVHVHLLLNHFPTIGTIIGFGVLLLALVKKSSDLKRASFAVFFIISLIALPTYMTGYPAQDAVADRPGVSALLIEQHQSAALLALIFMEATGLAAWYGLWEEKRAAGPSRWILPVLTLLTVLTMVLMANAANIGGEITHPEIASSGAGGHWAPAMFSTARVSLYQSDHIWAWPLLETLHYIGLSLVLGVALIANLRILGVLRNAALVDIHRLLPWGAWGFVINSVSGMMFYAGPYQQYMTNVSFHWKVLFMLLVGLNVLYLTMSEQVWTLRPGEDAPSLAKFAAATQVFLWVGVIFFGRMLPYIGDAY